MTSENVQCAMKTIITPPNPAGVFFFFIRFAACVFIVMYLYFQVLTFSNTYLGMIMVGNMCNCLFKHPLESYKKLLVLLLSISNCARSV